MTKEELKTALDSKIKAVKDSDKTGLVPIAIGGTLAVAGASMIPSAISFGRSARALSRSQKYPRGLRDREAGELVSNYLQGGQRFGRSIPGKVYGALNSKIDRLDKAVKAGDANVIEKVLERGAKDAGISGDEFSRLHMKSFTDKNPKTGFNFWLGVEALGKSKGQFEAASRKVVDDIGARTKYKNLAGKSDSAVVEDLINYGILDKKTLRSKIEVPTYSQDGAKTVNKGLGSLHNRYTADQKSIIDLQGAVKDEQIKSKSSLYEAIRNVDMYGTPEQKKTLTVMALDKANIGAPQKYFKQTAIGATGLIGTGTLGIAYGTGKRKNSK